jgi:hypothetical protein
MEPPDRQPAGHRRHTGAMVVVAWVIERLALRHLVNQEPITC